MTVKPIKARNSTSPAESAETTISPDTLPRTVTAASEQPNHEQHPGRHERQRPLLAAKSEKGNQRASRDSDGNEGEPGEACRYLGIHKGEHDQAELRGDPAEKGQADPIVPKPQIEEGINEK